MIDVLILTSYCYPSKEILNTKNKILQSNELESYDVDGRQPIPHSGKSFST